MVVAVVQLDRPRAIGPPRLKVGAAPKQLVDDVRLSCHHRPVNGLVRAQVASVQKFGDTHIPEEMRIETVDPNNGKRTGLTYMTFDKPKKQ